MLTSVLSWVALIIILLSSMGILLSPNWRFSLGLLAAQYLAAFGFVALYWTPGMATVKLITGWMSVVILGMTSSNLSDQTELGQTSLPQGRVFQLLAAAIVILLVIVLAPGVQALIPGIRLTVVISSLLIIGLGMIHLSMAAHVLRVIIALLSILNGFETLYAVVESSVLVTGLLAITNLGMALVGSYLLIHTFTPHETIEEE